MPRRKVVAKRTILPDPKFGDEVVAKFINHVMERGKKSVAERIVYGAFDIIEARKKDLPADVTTDDGGESGGEGSIAVKVFSKALDNVKPMVEVKSRRVGGSTYQVPIEVRADRRMALAMRWLVDFSKQRSEKTMTQRLAGEIIDAIQGRGGAVRKREDTHRMAKANQAFAHYRW